MLQIQTGNLRQDQELVTIGVLTQLMAYDMLFKTISLDNGEKDRYKLIGNRLVNI